MESENSGERKELWRMFELSQEMRRYHQVALWEEEKHFTWWISIILPTLVLVYSHPDLCVQQKVAIVTAGCLFGAFLSHIGYRVIRQEGEYFKEAMETFCRTSRTLGLQESPKPHANSESDLALMPHYSVNESFCQARKRANMVPWDLLWTAIRLKRLGGARLLSAGIHGLNSSVLRVPRVYVGDPSAPTLIFRITGMPLCYSVWGGLAFDTSRRQTSRCCSCASCASGRAKGAFLRDRVCHAYCARASAKWGISVQPIGQSWGVRTPDGRIATKRGAPTVPKNRYLS